MNKLVLSIDLDEWYHARWCTGSEFALWRTTKEFFREYYGQDQPIGELIEPTDYILETLDRYKVKCTFFVLGEVACYYGALLRKIADKGHEIACHGLSHKDMSHLTKSEFIKEVSTAKIIIEDVVGQKVQGFRAPNAIIPPYLIMALEEMEFCYDSSMFPSRSFMGKYGYTRAPLRPYRPSYQDIQKPGQSAILELPVAVFPGIRLVAGSGIFTRIFGYWWTKEALKRLLQTSDAMYYFHPYELMPKPKVQGLKLKNRIFLLNCGQVMRRYFRQLLEDFNGGFMSAIDLVQTITGEIR